MEVLTVSHWSRRGSCLFGLRAHTCKPSVLLFPRTGWSPSRDVEAVGYQRERMDKHDSPDELQEGPGKRRLPSTEDQQCAFANDIGLDYLSQMAPNQPTLVA